MERVGTGRDRVSVSLNALCVSVIRNLMALSEIPKLYLAGRGSHHSAPHNLLINSKKKGGGGVDSSSPTPSSATKERGGKEKGPEAKLEVWGSRGTHYAGEGRRESYGGVL